MHNIMENNCLYVYSFYFFQPLYSKGCELCKSIFDGLRDRIFAIKQSREAETEC